MRGSESIIQTLFIEVDSLTSRLRNIKQCLKKTSNTNLAERLVKENKFIFYRLNEILSISKLLRKNTTDKITFSYLLEEKCKRSIHETKIQSNLFFF